MDRSRALATLFIALVGIALVVAGLFIPSMLGAADWSHGSWRLALVVVFLAAGIGILLCATLSMAEAAGLLENFRTLYRAIRLFFNSGVFYIVLGSLFLLAAYSALDNVHSAFVFLLAILGVAIVLYGTGTQAAGTGNTGTLNVAIAGGAGVLAAVFGFGVINYAQSIQDVFKGTVDYGVLSISNSDIQSLDFQKDYDVIAELYDGTRLHLWRKQKAIQIILPIHNANNQSTIIVSLNPKIPYEDRDDRNAKEFPIKWSEAKAAKGEGNEQWRYIERPIALRQLPTVKPEAGTQVVITPQ